MLDASFVGCWGGPFAIVLSHLLLLLDLQNFPQPTSLIAVTPGDTFNFQYWTRDLSSGGSNFSEALSVTFQ